MNVVLRQALLHGLQNLLRIGHFSQFAVGMTGLLIHVVFTGGGFLICVGFTIGSLAAVHNLMGNGALAEPLHREALAIRERLLGSDHIDTLNSRYGLGRSLVQLGRHEDGFGLLENVSACAHRVFGAKHPTCQHFQRGLASLKQGTGPAES